MKKIDPRQIIDIDQDHGLTKKKIETVIRIPKAPFDIPKYHWTPDKKDSRDYLYKSTAVRLAKLVDLRSQCSSIENQGPLGSCTGQAIAGAIELLNKRNKKPTDVSRLFIYYYERVILGTVNYDSGAYIRDGIKSVNRNGSPLESLWPYIISKFTVQPTMEAITDGAKRKVTLYERITDFKGCLDALTNGYPVTIGFQVFSSFESASVRRTGIMPYPNRKREKLLGGHAVLLVGYDSVKKVFIARNSWGSAWGDKGYFYMPFAVIEDRTMSSDFWVIKSVENP